MRYTPEDRARHIALWQESGLSKAGYCRTSGLCYKTFCSWTHRQSASTADEQTASAPAFVQVVDHRPQRDDASLTVEVGPDDGLRLCFSAGAAPDWVAAVITSVRPC